jgi:hypothetical protein
MDISDIDICNLALGHIAASEIQGFSERSVEARACKRFYRPMLDATLEAIDWHFARGFSPSVQLDLTPQAGFTSVLQFPADALAVRGMSRDFSTQPHEDFVIGTAADGTRVIHTTYAGQYIRYTREVTDTTVLSPMFVDAFSWHLAFAIAPKVIKNWDIARNCMQVYQGKILEARASSQNQGQADVDTDPDPDWIAART